MSLGKYLLTWGLAVSMLFCGCALAQEQPAEVVEEQPAEAQSPQYAAGTYSGKSKGYGGYVTATLTIDENGVITDVKLAGEGETPYVGGYAIEEMPQWILAAQSAEVDAYSGATFTRDAVVAATQEALSQAAPRAAQYAAGTYSGKSKGYGGYVTAALTIDENGVITDVKLTGDGETPYVGGYAIEEMPQWILAAQSAEVDAYSGATFTRDAVVAATQEALDQARK